MLSPRDEKIFRQSGLDPKNYIVHFEHDEPDDLHRSRIIRAFIYNRRKYLRDKSSMPLVWAYATCNTSVDNFRKDTGRAKALGRALSQLLKQNGKTPAKK